jgi:hypothetical protein
MGMTQIKLPPPPPRLPRSRIPATREEKIRIWSYAGIIALCIGALIWRLSR